MIVSHLALSLVAVALLALRVEVVSSFHHPTRTSTVRAAARTTTPTRSSFTFDRCISKDPTFHPINDCSTSFHRSLSNKNDETETPFDVFAAIDTDQLILGVSGTIAALVVFYSEYVLSQTGCGLPAGPFGVFGAIEGLSYLEVAGIVTLSATSKVTTGSGLPAGRFGVLGAAEGLSYLAVVAGLVVLAFQITNYGYIPNAVPMEGGMCQ